MIIHDLLQLFDEHLKARRLSFDAIVIGGVNLDLSNAVPKLPKELGVLCPPIFKDIIATSLEFAMAVRQQGKVLRDDWLVSGPCYLVPHLRPKWLDRLQLLFAGDVLRVRCLSSNDRLVAQLFLLCDRGIGFGDCLALAPSARDLESVLPWLEEQHVNLSWPAHVRTVLAHLAKSLGQ